VKDFNKEGQVCNSIFTRDERDGHCPHLKEEENIFIPPKSHSYIIARLIAYVTSDLKSGTIWGSMDSIWHTGR
jgi:hypothetical protein